MLYRDSSYEANKFDAFFYERNLQGDIIAVYDCEDTKLVSYTYDAWGNVSITYSNSGDLTGAQYNPFTYRGYYRDSETGFYYLNTRYYDAVIGRFINADEYVSTGQGFTGYNMFAYCGNNPVMNFDPNGALFKKLREKISSFKAKVEKKWEETKDFLSSTFGFAVVQSNKYEHISAETIFAGYEDGIYSSKVIAGDMSKPISFYIEKPAEWWKISEYKVGVQININGGGANFAVGLGEVSAGVATQNKGLEVIAGINKVGFTITEDVDFKTRQAGVYQHSYVRTSTIAAVVIICYICPQLAPVIGGYALT